MTDAKRKKPTQILKEFFGRKGDQDLKGFAAEVRQLKLDEDSYREVVTLAAEQMGVEIDW